MNATTGEFERLLKQVIGLDAASVGSPMIERAVRQRLAACGDADASAYLRRLAHSPREMQELIEAVVVPETWFFRHRESYDALTRLLIADYQQAGLAPAVLRLLSLPCSSGEEPYSMAMALLDAGMAPAHFRIDAIDVSRRALRNARRAFYGRNSFRGEQLEYRARHFTPLKQEWHVNLPVRRQVRFRHGNLFAPDLEGGYDVVFCRNVLIYFDRETQDRAVAALDRLLTPRGLLFVGPSETSLLQRFDFTPIKLPLAFAFRRGAAPASAARAAAVARMPMPAVGPLPAPRSAAPAPAPRVAQVSARDLASPAEKPLALLDRAARLADDGQLDQAAQLCEQYRRTQPPSARLFYLLGLLRDTAGDADGASDHYRKALYLDPQHPETLSHLALLLEKRGDAAGARLLRNRSLRLTPKGQHAP